MKTVDIISIKNNIFRFNKIYSNVDNNEFIENDIFSTIIPLKVINGELNGELNNRQKLVYQQIRREPGINAKELSAKLKIPYSTVDKYIRLFIKNKLIERQGSKKTGGYYERK
jgi:ATP-dependent DNA helicase RecG